MSNSCTLMTAVSRITSFWAGWKRQLQLTWREEAKRLQIAKTGATPSGSANTSAASTNKQTTPPSSSATTGEGGEKRKVWRHSSCLISQWRSPHATTLVPPRLAPDIPKRTTSKSCGSTQLRLKRPLSMRPISILYV